MGFMLFLRLAPGLLLRIAKNNKKEATLQQHRSRWGSTQNNVCKVALGTTGLLALRGVGYQIPDRPKKRKIKDGQTNDVGQNVTQQPADLDQFSRRSGVSATNTKLGTIFTMSGPPNRWQ